MNNEIALIMIVKGEGEEYKSLDRALSSVHKYVDGMYITITGEEDKIVQTKEVCEKYKVNISYYRPFYTVTNEIPAWLEDAFGWKPNLKEGQKLFLFDDARNFNMSQVPKDYTWLFWMDSDDIVRGAENLKMLAQQGIDTGTEAIYLKYLYQTEYKDIETCQVCGKKLDEPKIHIQHIIIEHLRERLLRNDGAYKWIAPIHETLIEQRPTQKIEGKGVEVVHLATMQERMNSLTRNLGNLEYSIYKTEGKDPRHIYYLAKAFFDIGTPEYDDKCIKLIFYYLLSEHKSGWPQERAQAWNYLSEIYKRRQKYDQAIRCCLNSLVEYEEDPATYLGLATCYMLKQQWERALFWVKLSTTIAPKQTTLVINTKDMEARKLEVIYNCCINLHQVDEAWAAAVKLVNYYPTHEGVKRAFNFVQDLRTQRDLTKNVVQLAEYLKKSGERPKIKALLASAPNLINQNPFIVNLFQQNNPPRTWEQDEIAIYCGMGFTNWSPKIMDNPKNAFVGGSEEAVIMLTEALAKKGWKISVFGDPGNDEGEINGVKWLPYYKFNRNDYFNILIGWRDIRFFDTNFHSNYNYLWLHDIQNPLEWTKERFNNITKAFFLSKWHRDNVPGLPERKVMITSNGI